LRSLLRGFIQIFLGALKILKNEIFGLQGGFFIFEMFASIKRKSSDVILKHFLKKAFEGVWSKHFHIFSILKYSLSAFFVVI